MIWPSQTLSLALGLAWGALAARPLLARARRLDGRARARALGPTRVARSSGRARALRSTVARASGPVGRVATGLLRRRAQARTAADVQRGLPVTIDLLAVAVGAGCTPYLAVDTVAGWAPPPLDASLRAVRVACSRGAALPAALDELARTTPDLRALVDALLVSDRYGAPVVDALGRLAVEERAALRRRAETRARTVPVRMLFPLVFLVLPAFGLLTVAPTLLTGFAAR